MTRSKTSQYDGFVTDWQQKTGLTFLLPVDVGSIVFDVSGVERRGGGGDMGILGLMPRKHLDLSHPINPRNHHSKVLHQTQGNHLQPLSTCQTRTKVSSAA